MFIVKAMRPHQGFNELDYTVFQCDYYTVAPSKVNGCGPPGKPYIAPQWSVDLHASAEPLHPSSNIASLEVGVGENQYCTVYIMNDRGKTIDTIQARE